MRCGRYSDELKFGKGEQLGFLILKKMYSRLFFVLFIQMCRNFAWPWKFTKILFSSLFMERIFLCTFPPNIYLFKFNSRSTRKRCGICSQSTIKTSKRRHWRPVVFDVNCELISHLFLVFLLSTMNMWFFLLGFSQKIAEISKITINVSQKSQPFTKNCFISGNVSCSTAPVNWILSEI